VDDLTLEEIGEKIGRSNEWVRQLINRTLATMEA
jgi:DNA-directed RNA polymerase sigma subunit (sigma70/sigma32)